MLRNAGASLRRLGVLRGHLRQAGTKTSGYDYDLIVIGGGSGGLACSKEAAALGMRVAVLDYVSPSPQGSSWGLGGTCVNVGCIPKKLMHQAALLGHAVEDARSYGWSLPDSVDHSWGELTSAVKNHIKSLNWGHRVQLRDKSVDYFNAQGSFVDQHSVEALRKDGSKTLLTSEYFVIAVGGRPKYPDNVPGAREFGITSDDLFFLEKPPGKTLVVGASYIALECAGFLAGLAQPTSLLVRSRCLKAFDQDVVALVVRHLEQSGVNVLRLCQPRAVERGEDGRLRVTWESIQDGWEVQEWYDTVLFATGREAAVSTLHLHQAGVKSSESGIILCEGERTTAPNIFAIGDVGPAKRWHLTPVAVRAGKLLARRLFGDGTEHLDYDMIPTTVFTPLEFAAVGLTEEEAIARWGRGGVEVYHAFYKPLEFYLPQRDASQCYIKLVCAVAAGGEGERGEGERGRGERVVGLHITGPSAGEVMQGFAVAIRHGVTRADIEATLGIHPTCAEEIIKLHVSKSSGADPTVTAC